MMNSKDTIFALSSGALPSGVAVIRLSGSLSAGALVALCGRVPAARRASLLTIRDRNGEKLDDGLIFREYSRRIENSVQFDTVFLRLPIHPIFHGAAIWPGSFPILQMTNFAFPKHDPSIRDLRDVSREHLKGTLVIPN